MRWQRCNGSICQSFCKGDNIFDKRYHRWLLPLITFLVAVGITIAWLAMDPRLAGLRFATSGNFPRSYFLGFKTLDLFDILHRSLLNLGLISIGLFLLSTLVALLRPRFLGITSVFALSTMIYAIGGGLFLAEQSPAPHYVYLADAFAHGKYYLEAEPPNAEENDWTYYNGKWMISFPPTPALLMTPFVAVFGRNFNDVIFTALFGALNVAIVYDLVPKVGQRLKHPFQSSTPARLGIAALFGFGTVHWWVTSVGQVWFTAQIVAVTFLLLALRETFEQGRPILVSTWLVLSAMARPTILLSLPIFIWLLCPTNTLRRMLLGLIPLGLAGFFMVAYNLVRFGDPFELGYRYMQLEKLLEKTLEEHGTFSLAYLGRNLYYAFLDLPKLSPRWPYVLMDGWGLSLFISTPALVYIFLGTWRERIGQTCALAACLVAAPSLLYYNTGYLQAGYRYVLDFMPFLVVPIVIGMGGKLTRISVFLILLSICMGFLSLVNFYGLYFEWF